MKTLAIFVVSLAITVAMQLKESPPIQSVDPRPIESWGFMGSQPPQSPPSVVGTWKLRGFQLPTNDSLPVRLPSLRSRSGKSYKPVFFSPFLIFCHLLIDFSFQFLMFFNFTFKLDFYLHSFPFSD